MKRQTTKPLLPALVLGLISVNPVWAQGPGGPAPVKVAPIQSQSITTSQTYVGTVMPTRRSVIGSAVDGRVKVFPHNEGDRVEQRSVLAEIRDRTISLELAAREAERDAANEAWLELKNGSRPEEIEQAEARLAAAKAIHMLTKSRLDRSQKLFERGSISPDELAETVSAEDAARARLEESVASLKLAKQGPRREQLAQAEFRYKSLLHECERLADQKERHKMVSPFAGFVVAEHTEAGAWVKRGDPIATVVELDDVHIQVMVLEQHINHVKLGAHPKHVLLTAINLEIPRETATVDLIVPDADIRSRSFPVKIRVKNQFKHKLPVMQPGMLARVTLELVEKQVLLVPKDALVLGKEPHVMLVQRTAGKVTAVPVVVQLGEEQGSLIQVTSDKLAAGQQVVVVGNERLRGGEIEIVNPAAAAQAER